MKTIIKLLIAAAIVHATWKTGNAFFRYYKLKDGAHAAALFAGARSEGEIQNRVLDIARELDVPVNPANVEVRRVPNHTYIDASYTEKIEVLPSYFYPWDFKLHLDVLTMTAPKDAKLPDQ
jgi:hypothetical protein